MKIEQALPKYLIRGNLISNNDEVGIKALNLHIYHLISPEFFVIDYNFFLEWKKIGSTSFRKNNKLIEFICIYFQRLNSSTLIIRSSSSDEAILDRGKFLSLKCAPNVKDVQTLH